MSTTEKARTTTDSTGTDNNEVVTHAITRLVEVPSAGAPGGSVRVALITLDNGRDHTRPRPEGGDLSRPGTWPGAGPGRRDPALLRAARIACGADAASTTMIGDTSHDIAMAVAAGAHPLGVGWGFHTVEEQADAGALHIAVDFPDLEAALDRFASTKLFA